MANSCTARLMWMPTSFWCKNVSTVIIKIMVSSTPPTTSPPSLSFTLLFPSSGLAGRINWMQLALLTGVDAVVAAAVKFIQLALGYCPSLHFSVCRTFPALTSPLFILLRCRQSVCSLLGLSHSRLLCLFFKYLEHIIVLRSVRVFMYSPWYPVHLLNGS